MISIQEVIIHLEKKITEYRYQEKRTSKAKTYLQLGREVLTSVNTHSVKNSVLHQLNSYATSVVNNIMEVKQYFQRQLTAQKTSYEQKIEEMQKEICRQRSLITDMKKEVEDLQELIIENSQRFYQQQPQQRKEGENNLISQSNYPIINGLQTIEEEQTDRTIISSVRSVAQDCIRIQEKDLNEKNEKALMNKQVSQFQSIPFSPSVLYSNNQSYEEEWQQQRSSIYKFQHLMEGSSFSRRENTFNSEPGQSQFESLPLSMQGYNKQTPTGQNRGHRIAWEQKHCPAELKDITNNQRMVQAQRQKQQKSKMVLQQFCKTFKCLSSANPSRKTSTKTQKSSSKAGEIKSWRQIQGHDNKRLINEMLRDIDNNNKFCVGSAKNEQKYQGERKDNVRHGRGVLYYKNGLQYQGQFKNNMRHGLGILKFNQKGIYEGQWNADELSGSGRIRNLAIINKRKDQNINSPLNYWVTYCGNFKNNRFEGEGTLCLKGGENFLGKFICGMACGQGTLYRKNGQIQTGIWRNSLLVQQF